MLTARSLVALLLALTGCAGGASTATSSTSTIPPPSTSTTTTTPPPVTDPPDVPVCLDGDIPFSTGGLVATLGERSGDAAVIGGIGWADHGRCERLVIDLLTAGGAPAGSLGEATVSFRDEVGIVRVELPARATGIAASVIEGRLVERVYVVRLPDGRLAADIHLGTDDAVEVRGFDLGEPTRVVVDIGPSDDGMGRLAAPTLGDNVVVLTPPGGPAEYPLVISGYARTFEANVVAILSRDGAEGAETFTTATDWAEAWGAFEIVFEAGPDGSVTLFVGEFDARDGSPVGVEIALELS